MRGEREASGRAGLAVESRREVSRMDGRTGRAPYGFALSTPEKLAMRAFWQFFETRRPIIVEELGRALADGAPEIQAELARTVKVENAQRQYALQRAAVLEDRWEPYLEEMRALGATYANAGVGYSAWMWRTANFRDAVRRQVLVLAEEHHDVKLLDAKLLVDGLLHLVDVTLESLLSGFIAAKETLIDRSEEQLRQAQKMEAVGRMAGGIAHDFNNMLTVVEGYATFLEDSLAETDERREDASEIRRAAERAGRLTRQLLVMSRHSIVTPRPVRVDDVVNEFSAILRRLLGERITLVCHRREAPAVMVDVGQLEQVLMNLAVNARDAMPTGGRLTIETRVVEVDEEIAQLAGRTGRHVVLAVTDTGIGMDVDTQRRIFDPFFTTKGAARGTGLGMSIVHGIVTQAGGVISVYSQPGRGTTFNIYLPATTETALAVPVETPVAPKTLPPSTILIVDDDREVREVAVRILNDAGCRTLEAAGAEDARRICVSHDGVIDAAVIDVALTDGRGDDLAHHLRALRPALPVLLVSGYPAGALTVEGAAPPDLLAKPYTPARLRAAMASVLGPIGEPARAPAQPAAGPSRPAVLLAEDDFLLRGTVTRVLETSGCTVVAVESAAEAMRALESRSFDVIVSDVYMPGGDGTELLRSVRRLDLDIPIILMSGTPSVEVATKAIEYGAFRYLTKPLDYSALTRLVKHATRAHALARLRRDAFSLKGQPVGAVDRAGLEVRFDQALDGLWMAFQPVVDASTGAPFGVEALMRSTEPTMAGPLALLEAAGQLGHLTRLSRRVRALSAAATEAHDDLTLFINLHPDDLLDVDLVDELAPLTRFAPRVILEVTERASLTRSPELRARLDRIRALGFRLAVDDIGAGYSGLTSFTELTPELVKIDMSLVRDVHVTALKQRTIAALCRLCHEVGTLVVAEGVETVEERDCLQQLGCDLLQGYFIGRPGPLPAARGGGGGSGTVSATPRAIVDTLVDTSILVLRSHNGEQARLVSTDTTRRIDPPPSIAISIELTGGLRGAVTWVFSPELARTLARGMLEGVEPPLEAVVDAMAELANICAGNATHPLMRAGYQVEISTPIVHDTTTSRELGREVVTATIESPSGSLRILFALEPRS
ncbi:MAG TPA: EAL domain-containing protein [Kofleriaceae bacterium]|nr:EAL domain-containing protein [Kofleriaceae bacterium]